MPKVLNAFHLKLVAIFAMLANHTVIAFNLQSTHYGLYLTGLVLGKLTFPIMAFLLVEGFRHTHATKRYAGRLALFWILSIVPFWLLFHGSSPFSIAEIPNNILFTLLMGLLLLQSLQKAGTPGQQLALLALFSIATLQSDWMLFGVFMIYGFYNIRNPAKRAVIPVLYTMAAYMLLLLLEAAPPASILPFLGMLLPIPLLLAYNGKRGYSPGWVKWGFYAFYPAHLLGLFFLQSIVK